MQVRWHKSTEGGDHSRHCAINLGFIKKLGKLYIVNKHHYEGEFREGSFNGQGKSKNKQADVSLKLFIYFYVI